MDLEEWLREWIELYVVPVRVAPRTLESYRDLVTKVARHPIGQVKLAELDALTLRRYIVAEAAEHPRTAQLLHQLLRRALKVAAKLRLCAADLMDEDTNPRPRHRAERREVLTADECRTYLDAAETSPAAPLLMAALCGLRRGELLGLRWEDYDGQVIQIRRQRIRIRRAYLVTGLKSEHARRALVVPDRLRAVLDRWPRSVNGWIVDITPEQLRRELLAVLDRAGIARRITLHCLRHTYATLAVEDGQELKAVQLALGHAQIGLTADLYADHITRASPLSVVVWAELGHKHHLTLNQGV